MTRNLLISSLLSVQAIVHAASPSHVILKTSAPKAVYGHPVQLTASVSPAAAAGHVTFYSGVMLLETEPISNGVATFTTSSLQSGAHSITAYYSGDSTYAPSKSSAVIERVGTVPSNGFAAPVFAKLNGLSVTFALGDFNGDGKMDLAVVNAGTSGVVVLLGNGNGTFGEPVSYPGPFGYAMVVGDFNGDGKPDIAVQTSPSGISVLLGNGDGTFQPPLVTASGEYDAYTMVVADFNQDGKADLAVPNFASAGVDVLLGNGDGTFHPPITYASGISAPPNLALGDFNGDGKADLAVCTGQGVSILLGNGDGSFQSGLADVLEISSNVVAEGDFNGDGKADLVTGTVAGTAVQLGNGDGTFQLAEFYPLFGVYPGQATVAVGDINGDGKLDLVGYAFQGEIGGEIGVALGNGDGTFQAVRYSASSYLEYSSFALADFNGDGRVDMLQDPFESVSPPAVQLGSSAAASTSVLSSSSNPSQFGSSVTFTASVSPAPFAGTVTFYHANPDFPGVQLGKSAVDGGTAILTLSKLPGGTYTLYAVYGGDAQVLPSASNTLIQQVNPDPTSVALSSSPNPSAYGQPVTLVATVKPARASGTVTFFDGLNDIGSAPVMDGKAIVTTSALSEGAHSLQANYEGTNDYGRSFSAKIDQVVQ